MTLRCDHRPARCSPSDLARPVRLHPDQKMDEAKRGTIKQKYDKPNYEIAVITNPVIIKHLVTNYEITVITNPVIIKHLVSKT